MKAQRVMPGIMAVMLATTSSLSERALTDKVIGEQASSAEAKFAQSERNVRFALDTLQEYGWEEVSDAPRALSPAERKASGAVFSRPGTVREDAHGRVYVLDPEYKKVVVFDRDGGLKAVVLGGYGHGPGEFIRPTGLALGSDGSVFVYDRDNSSVTRFDSLGTYRNRVRLALSNPVNFEYTGDLFWLTRMRIRGPGPTVFAFRPDGKLADSTGVLSKQEANLAQFGELGALGRSRTGALLFATPTPSVWLDLSDKRRRGVNWRPEARGEMVTLGQMQGRSTTVRTRSIVDLGENRIALLVGEREPARKGKTEPVRWFIDVFHSNGSYLGSVAVPQSEQIIGMYPGIATGEAFVSVTDPYPMVLRVRLKHLERAR